MSQVHCLYQGALHPWASTEPSALERPHPPLPTSCLTFKSSLKSTDSY